MQSTTESEHRPAAVQHRTVADAILPFECTYCPAKVVPARGILKYASLAALTFQEVAATALLRFSQARSRNPDKKYIITSGVCMVQALKALTSLFLLRATDGDRYPSMLSAVLHTIAVTFSDMAGTMSITILCLASVAQSWMLFTAAKYLDTTVYLVISQLKTLAAAVFAVLMARRNISWLQWASLFLLVAGVATLQTSMEKEEKNKESSGNVSLGFLCLVGASLISGFAGTLFELLVKEDQDLSIWLRALQLNALSFIPAFGFAYMQDSQEFAKKGFFHGYDNVVWATIFAQAAGGLIVALVLKYADNVVRSFATAMSIVLSIFIDAWLFGVHLPFNALVGSFMVVLAIIGYTL